jgi:hypothetical protein
MYTEPPRPELAVPEPIITAPLLPFVDIPVLNITVPLEPLVPAFADINNKDPLDEMLPSPVTRDMTPPVENDDFPAESTTSPPDPLFPDPTVT